MPIYEVSDGDAFEAIEALCRHGSTVNGFSESTHPTLDEVRRYLSMAYYKVAGMLSRIGYDVEQTNANVLGWLQSLQVFETVILIELSYPTSGSGQPSARFSEFVNQRNMMSDIMLTDYGFLSGLGATKSASSGAELTGASQSRKVSVKDDSDLVPFRFNRGFAEHPGSPSGTYLPEDTQVG